MKHVFIVRNAFVGIGIKVRFRILEVPAEHEKDPAGWYMREVDYTSELLFDCPFDKWGGEWNKPLEPTEDSVKAANRMAEVEMVENMHEFADWDF